MTWPEAAEPSGTLAESCDGRGYHNAPYAREDDELPRDQETERNVRPLADAPPFDWQEHLKQGVFPCLFGNIRHALPAPPRTVGLAPDRNRLARGEWDLLQRRVDQWATLIRWNHAAATPCGYYLFHGLQAQSKLLQSCSQRMTHFEPDFEFSVPFFRWLADNAKLGTAEGEEEKGPAQLPQLVAKSTRTWTGLDQALRVVGGLSPLSLRSARNPMVLMDRWLKGTMELALSVPRGGDLEATANPKLRGAFLGSVAISQAAGTLAGLLYLCRLGGGGPSSLSEHVDALAHLVLAQLPPPLSDILERVAPGRSREVRLCTALTALDLAAFTPLHPRFAALRRGLRWTDLHPGHRLIQLLDILAEGELVQESTGAASYYKLTSALCRRLGWPEVPRFLDAATHGHWPTTDQAIDVIFRQACHVREEHPACFWDPGVALERLNEFPPLTVQLEPFTHSSRADGALQLAFEAQLYALGFQLFFGRERPGYLCPSLSGAVDLLYSPDELLHHFFGLRF